MIHFVGPDAGDSVTNRAAMGEPRTEYDPASGTEWPRVDRRTDLPATLAHLRREVERLPPWRGEPGDGIEYAAVIALLERFGAKS